jgi:hypothetical protein
MNWQLSWRADPVANAVAKRHYNSQSPDSAQWVKPGACLCFRTVEGGAIWFSSAPFAEYVQHAWAGAWENSTFRNERQDLYLSSDLIREGIAATLWFWPTPPESGMVTMVDAGQVRRKRDPGRCYRKAGFRHVGFTQGGLWVFHIPLNEMPSPVPPNGISWREQLRLDDGLPDSNWCKRLLASPAMPSAPTLEAEQAARETGAS